MHPFSKKKKSRPFKKYPKKRLYNSIKRKIYTAFVFLPTGTEIFEGSESSISSHLASYPTSHAILVSYIFGKGPLFFPNGKRISSRNWVVYGKNHYEFDFTYSRNKNGRRTIQLKHKNKVIGEWRKLPKKHLKQLKIKSKYSMISSD